MLRNSFSLKDFMFEFSILIIKIEKKFTTTPLLIDSNGHFILRPPNPYSFCIDLGPPHIPVDRPRLPIGPLLTLASLIRNSVKWLK